MSNSVTHVRSPHQRALNVIPNRGRVTARSIIEATLRRIERLDGSINAYRVVMAESAMATADRIDALPGGDRASLPLAGVPVAIKDQQWSDAWAPRRAAPNAKYQRPKGRLCR